MADPTVTTIPTPGPAPPPATVAPNAIPSGQVAVFNPDGKLVSISAADLPNAQAAGYEVASKDALHARSPTTLYDVGTGLYNVGDTLESGFRGVIHGATAGLNELGDKAVIGALKGDKAARNYAEEVTRQKEEHPLAFGGGELGGMVGGALVGSEAGLLGGVGKGLGAAGGFAENLAGRATAGLATRGALGRAVATGVGMGARGAAETGLYSGINELSEESLGKPELNAEKILSATGSGALGGFMLGGALGGAGSLARSGYGAVRDFASDVIAKNADKLEGLANEQRWRALDPNLKFTREANARVDGGTAAVGDVLKKYDIVGTDLKIAAREGGIDAIGPKIDEAVDKVGKQLGDLTGGSTGVVPVAKIADALDGIIEPMRKVAGREGVVKSLESYKESLLGKLSPGGEVATQATMGRATADELGAAMPFPSDVAKTSAHVFDGAVPTADTWRSMWRPPEGYEIKFKKFASTDGGLAVEAHVVDSATGKSVGELERTFSRDGDKLSVKHDIMHLDPAVQNQGIARALHDSSLETYAKLGVNEVNTHAAMTGGRYSNARLGFSWPKEAGAEWQQRLQGFLEERGISDAGTLSNAALEGAPAVARLKVGDQAIGKEFMLQAPNWAGKLGVPERSVSLQDALFQRKGLDQMVYQEAKSLDPHMRVQLLRDFRAKFEGLIVDAFDDAAKAAGNPEAKGQLLGLKKDYQALSIAQDAAETSTSRMQTNRNLSLSDYISGGIASNIGKGVGGLVGGAPGAFLGGLAGGAAGSVINRVGRDRGNAIAAAALDKASAFARARQAIEKTDEAITAAAKGIVDGPRASSGSPYRSLPSAVAVTEGGLRARFDAARDSVKDIQQNAKALTERAMVPSDHMPKTGAAVGQLALRTAGYLVSQLPAPMVPPTLGRPWPTRVSDPEMSAYLEKFRAATDPPAAMRAFASGRLTMNMANALKEVRPEIFQQIQAKAMDMVIAKQAKGDPLPYDARQRMSILLGIITDPSQDPKMMAALQSNLAGADTTPGAGGPGAKGASKSGAQLPSMTTKLNKLEES